LPTYVALDKALNPPKSKPPHTAAHLY